MSGSSFADESELRTKSAGASLRESDLSKSGNVDVLRGVGRRESNLSKSGNLNVLRDASPQLGSLRESNSPRSRSGSLRESDSRRNIRFVSARHESNSDAIFDEGVDPVLRERLCVFEQLRMEVKVEDRRFLLKSYPQCFLGNEAVDSLIQILSGRRGVVATREMAVRMGDELLHSNLIQHVTRDHNFKDAPLFYRFMEEIKQGPSWESRLGVQSGVKCNGKLPLQRRKSSNVVHVLSELTIAPLDEYNLELMNNVHPLAWKTAPPERYTMLIIGGGIAGRTAAVVAAELGASVVLCEIQLIGGQSLNSGIVPSKALAYCARRFKTHLEDAEFGITFDSPPTIDFGAVMDRMRRIRCDMSSAVSAVALKAAGVDVVFGKASFIDSTSVLCGSKHLEFSRAVICTGSRAAVPDIVGLSTTPYLTTDSLFNLTQLPQSMIIIGGGFVALEMGAAFSLFGCQVTIITQGTRLISSEDEEAADAFAQVLQGDGATLVFQAIVMEVKFNELTKTFTVDASVSDESGTVSKKFTSETLLVAVGRAPNVFDLNCAAAGVQFDEGGICINEILQTSSRGHCIYAAGDCCQDMLYFGHAGEMMARIAARNALLSTGKIKFNPALVPYSLFLSPEYSHIGVFEGDVTTQVSMLDNDRTMIEGANIQSNDQSGGFVKIYSDEKGRIVGATIFATNASEMMNEISLCMHSGVSLSQLASVMHGHPTFSHALQVAAQSFERARVKSGSKFIRRKLVGMKK